MDIVLFCIFKYVKWENFFDKFNKGILSLMGIWKIVFIFVLIIFELKGFMLFGLSNKLKLLNYVRDCNIVFKFFGFCILCK